MRTSDSSKWAVGAEFPCFVAEMDFQPAPEIRQALSEWAQHGWFGYAPPSVIRDFQESIAEYYAGLGHLWKTGLVRPVSDLVTLFHAIIDTFLAPDDPIILMAPTYMNFVAGAEQSAHPVRTVTMIPDFERRNWQIDWPGLESAMKDGGLLVLVNPHNPIGKSYTRAELERIAAIAAHAGARVLADEIHAPLTYQPHRHVPFVSVSPAAEQVALTAFSATKAYSIPGTKAAALLISNEEDLSAWKKRSLHLEYGTATSGMIATIAALRKSQSWFDDAMSYLTQNRQHLNMLVEQYLPEANYLPPEATYLAWLDLRQTKNYTRYATSDGTTLARNLCRATGVLATDGLACGAAGEGHIRINYAAHQNTVEQIIRRLGAALS